MTMESYPTTLSTPPSALTLAVWAGAAENIVSAVDHSGKIPHWYENKIGSD
jgi:hypothetical protein